MDFDEAVRIIRQKDPRYQPQAYDVVRLGLDLALTINWVTQRVNNAT